MKVKHTKREKEKRNNLRKLTTQKMKKRSACKKKNMFACKDTSINVAANTDTDDTQNIHLADEPVCSTEKATTQSSLKRKKKQLSNEGTVDKSSSDLQHFMNDHPGWGSSEQQADEETDDDWKLVDSEEETHEDTDDDWTQIAPKEKRNIGSPLVVEMLSDGVTSLKLPQIFEDEQKTRLNKETFHANTKLNVPLDEEGACVIVAESISRRHDVNVQTKYQKRPLILPSAIEDNKDRDICNKLDDISVNNMSSPDRRACNQKAPEVYCIRNMVIVIMEKGSRFCFIGKLTVKVLHGTVKIYGSTLNRSTGATEVYSPRGYSNVVVETSEEVFSEDSVDNVWRALAAEGITRNSESKLQVDIDRVRSGTVVLTLRNLENNLTRFLKTYFPYFRLFPSVKNPCYYPWTDPRRAEILLQANLHLEQYEDFTYRRLIVDPCVTTHIAEKMLDRWRANEWSCTLVAGGKSVGKSTAVRCLINSLLRASGKVVLVDVDPGQAECTPPGCISYSLIEEPLMGPNFTHLKSPVYQLYIDDVNVSRCVTRYLEGVKMLAERLKSCPVLSRLPIVVNTMGFTQSLGWDIAIVTIKLIRPSNILQITSSKKKKNYDKLFSAVNVNKQECSWTFCDERFIDWNRPCQHNLCVTHSQVETTVVRTNEWNMEPYQQRELAMMSYLSGILRDNGDSLRYNSGSSVSINEAVSYMAPFSSLCIIPQRLFGVPASRALSVVNGNIVALCGIDLTVEESSQESEGISSLRVLTQRSPLCTCYGFGIIRGIDMERQEVFINTPLPISIMQHVNCLAGCIPIPPALLRLHQGAPYVGGKAALPTSREPRRGYFRMRYQRKPSKSQ